MNTFYSSFNGVPWSPTPWFSRCNIWARDSPSLPFPQSCSFDALSRAPYFSLHIIWKLASKALVILSSKKYWEWYLGCRSARCLSLATNDGSFVLRESHKLWLAMRNSTARLLFLSKCNIPHIDAGRYSKSWNLTCCPVSLSPSRLSLTSTATICQRYLSDKERFHSPVLFALFTIVEIQPTPKASAEQQVDRVSAWAFLLALSTLWDPLHSSWMFKISWSPLNTHTEMC